MRHCVADTDLLDVARSMELPLSALLKTAVKRRVGRTLHGKVTEIVLICYLKLAPELMVVDAKGLGTST